MIQHTCPDGSSVNVFAACMLLVQDGKVLAIARQHNPNDLGLPGGKCDPEDETPSQTAIRELFEETGLIADSEPEFVYCDLTNSGHCCITYKISSWTGTLKGNVREGMPVWVDPSSLCQTTCEYTDYNLICLNVAGLL